MAYRRRQGMSRASATFKEEFFHSPPPEPDHDNTPPNLITNTINDSNIHNLASNTKPTTSHTFSSSSSLAAQAIRASAAHRDSSTLSSSYVSDSIPRSFRSNKVFAACEESSGRSDSTGFWGVLARKAKAILDDDNNDGSQSFETLAAASATSRFQIPDTSPGTSQSYLKTEGFKKMENPTLRKGLDKITSSLNQIGDTIEKAFEESRTIVENKTADIIQETRKLQIRRKCGGPEPWNEFPASNSSWQPLVQPTQPQNQMQHETQLKASRDVAMATAAKAKLLLRELKTVKADLAFAKQRCSQLEEENKILRESREKGGNPADDDLIRLQLETLLAEKARLAHENSVYARENRFLREIVEYHQLTMQDVVYLDEGNEEVTEVYPFTKMLSTSPPSPTDNDAPLTKEISLVHSTVEEVLQLPASDANQRSVPSMREKGENKIVPQNKEKDGKGVLRLEESAEIPLK